MYLHLREIFELTFGQVGFYAIVAEEFIVEVGLWMPVLRWDLIHGNLLPYAFNQRPKFGLRSLFRDDRDAPTIIILEEFLAGNGLPGLRGTLALIAL